MICGSAKRAKKGIIGVPVQRGRMVKSLLIQRRTKRGLLWSSFLNEPLATLSSCMAAFVLYKELHMTGLQVAVLTMLRPAVALLSFYWSAGSKGRLRANVLGAGILMRLPFLFFPWVDSTWYAIAAAVNYMLFYRAGTPAWVEILKRNLKSEDRDRAFSWSSAIGYAEGILLSIAAGALLDHHPELWKILYAGAAVLGLGGTIMQARVPVKREEPIERVSWKELAIRPWRDSWHLMRTRRDFSAFQWGFMVCGLALMLIQPALPPFIVDELGISYMGMAGAISIAKGLGFALSSPLWGRGMSRYSIHRMTCFVCLAMALFPLLLGFAKWEVSWFYAAYFLYGIAQGGSHLVWNMSGAHFAGKEESSRYTGVNVAMVGLRGIVGPALGGWMLMGCGAIPVLGIAVVLCFASAIGMLRYGEKQSVLSVARRWLTAE